MKNKTVCRLFLLGIVLGATLLTACSGKSLRINVVAKDFSVSLDKSQIEAGLITFVVQNEGSIQHDFAIHDKGVELKTPMIEPGESATLTVELEPGSYTYVCTVPGHEQLGMRGTFTVASK